MVVLALLSRMLLFLLCLLFSLAVRDYDSSAFLVRATQPDSHTSSHTLLGSLINAACKWDALFFLQIAHSGYLYEKNHAFFPLYPLLIRAVGSTLHFLIPSQYLSKDEAFLLAGLGISWVSFALSAAILEK
jgi:phosphatidylinositol glycan class V